ncbi:hypothetical protein PYW08_009828 [Mythimna loreyi]|uniref:Uncharacterized protein n=1 Tax=Mythimna loreyi TaxID=667449 RepID=A0ACC2Q716_9NEOP|nr:hypothetical protein PYW08_009828 [Mythimna loreyi]
MYIIELILTNFLRFRQNNTRVDDTKVVFVGRLEPDITKQKLGNKFAKFGHVTKVRIHSKEDGTRYGFVTYERTRDAWSAVRAAGTFAQYDVRFGAHCAFFKKSTADLGTATSYNNSVKVEHPHQTFQRVHTEHLYLKATSQVTSIEGRQIYRTKQMDLDNVGRKTAVNNGEDLNKKLTSMMLTTIVQNLTMIEKSCIRINTKSYAFPGTTKSIEEDTLVEGRD